MSENEKEYIVVEVKNTNNAAIPELKTWNTITYVLYALGYFLGGFPWLVAIVMNYLKVGDSVGTIYESHTKWQIRTFWWALIWSLVGIITAPFMIGFVILLANWIWVIYRVIKGFMKLGENKPVFSE